MAGLRIPILGRKRRKAPRPQRSASPSRDMIWTIMNPLTHQKTWPCYPMGPFSCATRLCLASSSSGGLCPASAPMIGSQASFETVLKLAVAPRQPWEAESTPHWCNLAGLLVHLSCSDCLVCWRSRWTMSTLTLPWRCQTMRFLPSGHQCSIMKKACSWSWSWSWSSWWWWWRWRCRWRWRWRWCRWWKFILFIDWLYQLSHFFFMIARFKVSYNSYILYILYYDILCYIR